MEVKNGIVKMKIIKRDPQWNLHSSEILCSVTSQQMKYLIKLEWKPGITTLQCFITFIVL
jgi:hypothetical protein